MMKIDGNHLLIALSLITLPFLIALPESAAEKASQSAATVPVYKPPMRGAPATRVGGASRGAPDSGLILNVLAPESTGLTSHAQPTLYWYSSKALSAPLEFTLNDEQSIKPLVEMKVNAPESGIHALKLNYTLKPEVDYQWNIAAVADPNQRASDTLASGTIKYVQPSVTLTAQLSAVSQQQRAFVYAEKGFWYDAIAALSEQIEIKPADRYLREQRAALLEQVGLEIVAAYERAGR